MINERYEIFNPNDLPIEELPVIYGFNNGGSPNCRHGELIAEDGTGLGAHICSDESFMYGDLGILKGRRSDRHEGFKKHYPNGYRMDFVPYGDVPAHPALNEAFRLNKEKETES